MKNFAKCLVYIRDVRIFATENNRTMSEINSPVRLGSLL